MLLLRPRKNKSPPMIASPAIAPMTMPAIAPPDIPDLLEVELATALPVDSAPVALADDGADVEGSLVIELGVVVETPEEGEDDEAATEVLTRFLVENGVGSTFCVVAVTLLTPNAER